MIVNPHDVHEGMTVFNATGESIGTISSVQSIGPLRHALGGTARDPQSNPEGLTFDDDVPPGVVAEGGIDDAAPQQDGYIIVDYGDILGFGSEEVHVPLSTVVKVVPGRSITVIEMRSHPL